jgi:serpin B
MDIHQLNALSKNLLQQFSMTDKKARFSMANAIWCNRKKLRLTPAFGELSETYYYSTVQSIPFNGRATAEKINRWMAQNTNRQCPPILQSARPNDLLYLTNACSFSCNWQHPFNAANTQMDFFYLPGGHRTAVPFMRNMLIAKTYSDTSFTMVELPYGNGAAYSLYVVLPDNLQQTVRAFAASFQEEKLYDAILRMNDQWVDLSLPRWKHAYDTGDLRPVLKQMGLGILSNEDGVSDLSNMCTRPKSGMQNTMDLILGREDAYLTRQSTPVSKFYHNTCFSVDENGTLAEAAATPDSVNIMGQRRSLNFKADHPFLYFVVAKQPQVVLMAGVVNDPTAAAVTKNPEPSPSRPAGLRLLHGIGHRRKS